MREYDAGGIIKVMEELAVLSGLVQVRITGYHLIGKFSM